MIFWWRRWIEHSRSNRWITLPWVSPKICTSMWRGSATYRSRNTVPSPNADAASRCGRRRPPRPARRARATMRMPAAAAAERRLHQHRDSRPSSPAGDRRRRPSVTVAPGSTGTPACSMSALAAIFEPIASIASGVGPTKISPASAHARANRRLLRQEPVAGVDRVGAGALRRGQDRRRCSGRCRPGSSRAGAPPRRPRRTNGASASASENTATVRDAHRARRAHDALRDLAAVGDRAAW